MDEDQTLTFFPHLISVCRQLDSRVKTLQERLGLPPGQNPRSYNARLETLSAEIKNFEIMSESTGKELAGTIKFSSYLNSMQDLVTTQAEGITKMEQYLAKFGYTPLPSTQDLKATTQTPSVQMPNGTQTNVDKISNGDVMSVDDGMFSPASPVLSGPGQLFLKRMAFNEDPSYGQVNSLATSSYETPRTSKHEVQLPPKEPIIGEFPSHSKQTTLSQEISASFEDNDSHRQQPETCNKSHFTEPQTKSTLTQDQWIEDVIQPGNNLPVGPVPTVQVGVQISGNRTPEGPLVKSDLNNRYQTSKTTTDTFQNNNYDIPPSPELSEMTMSFLSLMSNKNNPPSARDPQIKKTLTQDQWIQNAVQLDNQSPIEPVLSVQAGEKLNDNQTPEEPVMSNTHHKSADTLTSNVSDLPPSPELSEMTRRLLFTSHKQSTQPPVSETLYTTERPQPRSRPSSPVLSDTTRSAMSYTSHSHIRTSCPSSPVLSDTTRSVMSFTSHSQTRTTNYNDTPPSPPCTHKKGSTMTNTRNNIPTSPQLSDASRY